MSPSPPAKRRRRWFPLFFALVSLAAMLASNLPFAPQLGAARAETAVERAWSELAVPDADLAALAGRLPELAAKLEDGYDQTAAPPLLIYERDEASRKERATTLESRYEAARKALTAAGFELAGADARFTLVWVRHGGSQLEHVASADGTLLLVREPNVAAPPPAPPAPRPKREGGLPPREAMAHVLECWLWTQSAAVQAGVRLGPASVSGRIARLALDAAKLPDGVPDALRDGLVSWLEEQVDPRAKEAVLHACGGKPPAVLAQLDGTAPRTVAGARVLGRALAQALEGRKDVPEALGRYAATAGSSEARWAAAFGTQAKDVLAAATGAKAPADAKARCNAAGRVPCPACAGAGKLDLACEACVGLGGVACASCGGSAYCRAPMCLQGWHPIGGNKIQECRACAGYGSFACQHCKMKSRQPCKLCSSSGRRALPCTLCRGEKTLPCPEAGSLGPSGPTPDAPACAWCSGTKLAAACSTCRATGYAPCTTCRGAALIPCPRCDGLGCKECGQLGVEFCRKCGSERKACAACKGKGQEDLSPSRCLGCASTGKAFSPAVAQALRAAIGLPLSDAEREAQAKAIEKAIDFLLSCQGRPGDFRLREFRRGRHLPAGALDDPSPFANAIVLWTLTLAGIPPKDERVAGSWAILRKEAAEMVDAEPEEFRMQAAALTLRCLLSGRQEDDRGVMERLVRRLCDAQLSGGLWSDDAAPKGELSELSSLMVLESLFIAQRQGFKIPSAVWDRAFSGATKSTGMLRKSKRTSAFTTGTDVSSVAALLILARAGRDPQTPQTRESLLEIPGVGKALDWLERYADLDDDPVVAEGVLYVQDSDAAASAWLYAVQRLGQLLALDRLGSRTWYAAGARQLLARQLPDGSFEELGPQRLNGPVRATCSALLFLLRATPSVTGAAGK